MREAEKRRGEACEAVSKIQVRKAKVFEPMPGNGHRQARQEKEEWGRKGKEEGSGMRREGKWWQEGTSHPCPASLPPGPSPSSVPPSLLEDREGVCVGCMH